MPWQLPDSMLLVPSAAVKPQTLEQGAFHRSPYFGRPFAAQTTTHITTTKLVLIIILFANKNAGSIPPASPKG